LVVLRPDPASLVHKAEEPGLLEHYEVVVDAAYHPQIAENTLAYDFTAGAPPPERLFVVPWEDRTLFVPAENRTFVA
jgi:hypothetical protein